MDCLPRIFSPQGQTVNRHTPPPSARAAFVSFVFWLSGRVSFCVRHNRCVYLVTAAARSWREFQKKIESISLIKIDVGSLLFFTVFDPFTLLLFVNNFVAC